jgi:hypothetical protein
MAFGWDDAFLLSMTAAGALIPTIQAGQNQKLIKMGRELEQSAIETNLEALRAQSSQGSLEAIKQLRENVANQIAINAARGVSSGAGSGAGAIQKSESNFGQDEKTRRLNLMVKEGELRASNVLSGLHTLTSETQLGQSLTKQIFNNIPLSSIGDKYFPDLFKSKKEAKPKDGYGLTSV